MDKGNEIMFNNTHKAFLTKTDWDLKRSLWLFTFMKKAGMVKVFSKLTLFAIKVHLPVKAIIKATIFKQFCGGENIVETTEIVDQLKKSNIGSILDYSVEGKETVNDFERTLNEVLKIIDIAKNNHAIPYTCLKLTGIISFSLLEKLNRNEKITTEENEELVIGKKRLNKICESAFKNNVSIYFDAEESWIQDAIDCLAEDMMRAYNKEKAIVLTTLQMYRWDRINYLQVLIKQAKKEHFFIGIKLVRGAYLEKENMRAENLGYKSPIHTNKENTDIDFDKSITLCLENIDIITLCAGTHNEESTMYLITELKRLGIANNHPHVYFSQLYGMSDHISFNLAANGYNITKYLPYGPVKSVIPYLIRRANENTAIAGQMSRELNLLKEEKNRRKEQKLLK